MYQPSDQEQILALHLNLQDWQEDFNLLRQNDLLDEGQFISFCKERGLPINGIVTGDPGDFHKRGWLTSDGLNYKGDVLFHPFRVYPLQQIYIANKPNWLTGSLDAEQIATTAQARNKVIDLCILLEPIYWQIITGRLQWSAELNLDEVESRRQEYKSKVLELIETFDVGLWQKVHTSLRVDAAKLDQNDELYLLLRLSNWDQRKKLKGDISNALWLRHIAEVVRRGFEEVHSVQWQEEDQAFGMWFAGGRKSTFGFERPLDNPIESKPYLTFNFGLFTGSAVRWYVEGDTEYYSIVYAISEPFKSGIELVNLRGNIESGKDNAALKVNDWLQEDKAFRRFSIISLDCDVPANIKFIKSQVGKNNIVGYVAAHKPDFEFANFTVLELAEIAAMIDEAKDISGMAVRDADWSSVHSGRAFEDKYKLVSARKPRSLKGREWGEALAAYATDHPNRSDTGEQRPFWEEIRNALQGRKADYDFQSEMLGFDPETFQVIELKPKQHD